MAMLVHIGLEADAKRIKRNGIKASTAHGAWPAGVYAMPVLPNYFMSYQWLRELKRKGDRVFLAVRFRAASTEAVWVGHYNSQPLTMRLGDAVKIIMKAPDARGYQILFPRNVESRELVGLETVSKVIGWRYYPGAKGERPPTCNCNVCHPRGEIKGKKLKASLGIVPDRTPRLTGKGILARLKASRDEEEIDELLNQLSTFSRQNSSELDFLLDSPSAVVLISVIGNLEYYTDSHARRVLEDLCAHENREVAAAAALALGRK